MALSVKMRAAPANNAVATAFGALLAAGGFPSPLIKPDQVYAVYCYSLVPLIFSSIMSLSVMLVRTVDVNYRVARFLRLPA